MVAPVDHHVGRALKALMGWYYQMDCEANRDSWCLPPGLGGLRAWQRRVKMATWLAASWVVLREQQHLLRQSFVSTGAFLDPAVLDGMFSC